MLNKTHRCDRCCARALARVHKGEAELLFCNHHYEEHWASLMSGGWQVVERVPIEHK